MDFILTSVFGGYYDFHLLALKNIIPLSIVILIFMKLESLLLEKHL